MSVGGKILLIFALCSSWHMASRLQGFDGSNEGVEREEGVNVRLLLTRHAFSCANAVDQFGDGVSSTKMHVFMKDPMLTDCGVHRSKEGAKQMSNTTGFHPDLVLSSSLLRAMETAAFMFPNNVVVPCPYISESALGLDNQPKDVKDQISFLNTDTLKKEKRLSADRLDMQFMENGPFSGDARQKPDWGKFKKFIARTLLPGLPEHLHKKDLTIAVVTHSHFLKNIPELQSKCKSYYTDKPKNNQVLELNYRFTTKVKVLKSETKLETFINPFTKPVDMQQQIKQIFASADEKDETIFGDLVSPIDPPWNNPGFGVEVERRFEVDPNSECTNLIAVADKDKHMCKMDFGEVCKAEIQDLSYFQRPRLNYMEQKRAAAEKALKEFKRKGYTDSAAQAEKDLEELQSFACCTM